jgi:hypothetical protein
MPFEKKTVKKLLEAPSAAIFWKEIKKLSDPAPIPVSVTAEALRDVFETDLTHLNFFRSRSTQRNISSIGS